MGPGEKVIDLGIMGAYAEIYRRLLEQENLGPYFTKFHKRSMFYGIVSTAMAASRNSKWVLLKIFNNSAPILLCNYAFYL